jgi:hypothetical protein
MAGQAHSHQVKPYIIECLQYMVIPIPVREHRSVEIGIQYVTPAFRRNATLIVKYRLHTYGMQDVVLFLCFYRAIIPTRFLINLSNSHSYDY